jgi:hypothetical protein
MGGRNRERKEDNKELEKKVKSKKKWRIEERRCQEPKTLCSRTIECERKRPWTNLRNCSGVFLEGLRNTTKIRGQDILRSGWYS